MRKKNGFTMVEMIIALLIFGILAMGMAGLIKLGVEGYALSTTNSAQALAAQIAFDRISMELKDIDPYSTITVVQTGDDVTITYVNSWVDPSGTLRTLFYDDSEEQLTLQGHILLDDIDSSTFQISVNTADLNGDGNDEEVSDIFISYNTNDNQLTISGRIYPRAIAEYYEP